jgi:glycosyltransferase involved in cell wall biosynthesis
LDDLLSESNGQADILAPQLETAPPYKSIRLSTSAFTSGYVWEQVELPLRARRPILSLCNVGPLAQAEQVLCMHDANVFNCPDSYSRDFRLFYRVFLPRLARRAARLTTVSHAARTQIAQAFLLAEKDIVVLPNGHEHVLDWRPERSLLHDSVGNLRPFVLIIGSAALHKNIGLVLGLAEALESEGLDIVVAGGNAPIFANAPQGRAANVRFLGRVSDDDLAYLYRRALCLTFPSRFEGFGLPLLEAMTLGCPVVAAPIASSVEVCGDSALFAALDQPDQWLSTIKRIAHSRELRAEMAALGRNRAKTFSWRDSAQGYLDLAKWGRI